MPRTLTSTEARQKWADVLNRAGFAKERFLIERHGDTVAAIVAPDDLELLERRSDSIITQSLYQTMEDTGNMTREDRIQAIGELLTDEIEALLDNLSESDKEDVRKYVADKMAPETPQPYGVG